MDGLTWALSVPRERVERGAHTLAWLMVLAAAVLVAAAPVPLAITFAALWGAAYVAARAEAVIQPDRASRLAVDAVLGVVCFLGAFEGGWYFLPALAAFAFADVRGRATPISLGARYRLGTALGLAASITSIVSLAALAWVPAYSSATSGRPGSASVSFRGLLSWPLALLAITLGLSAAALIAAGVVGLREPSTRNRRLFVAGLGLLALSTPLVLGGAFLTIPALALGGVAFHLMAPRFKESSLSHS